MASLLGVGNHALAQNSVEDVSWNLTVAAGTIEAYRRFLQQYPTSKHAAEAFRAMVAEIIVAERDYVDPKRLSQGRQVTGRITVALAKMY